MKGFKAMLRRTDHFLELQESGVPVAGQWCNNFTMENWLGPLRGVHGTMDAELEVQCTIKRAEVTAFRRRLLTLSRCMLTIKELLMGCVKEK